MSEYLAKMKSTSDNLLLAGCPISNNDMIIQTLARLDREYNPIVVQLYDKIDLTWVDVQATLLTFESRLEQLSSLTNTFQVQANLVSNSNKVKTTHKPIVVNGEDRTKATEEMDEATIVQCVRFAEILDIQLHTTIFDMTRATWDLFLDPPTI